MPRKRIRSRKKLRPILTPAWRYFLTTGSYIGIEGKFDLNPGEHAEIFQLAGSLNRPDGNGAEKLKRLWDLHKQEILRTWKGKRLPWAAKEFDNNAQ